MFSNIHGGFLSTELDNLISVSKISNLPQGRFFGVALITLMNTSNRKSLI
jgi:hypothetical protein